jgi:acetyl esterase/lipase
MVAALRCGLPVRFVGVLLALLLGSGSAALAAASAPTIADVAYGADPAQKFDVWAPPHASGPLPAVVIFHGGGFAKGDRNPPPIGPIAHFTAGGFVVVNASYRLTPHAIFPAQMLDGARVVQWIRLHHADYGIDPNHIALMGSSAGAGIALWVALHKDLANPEAPDPVGRESTRIFAVVTANAQATYDAATIESIFHTRQIGQFMADFYGVRSPAELWDPKMKRVEEEASPVTYIHAGEPPILAFYNRDDDGLPPSDTPRGSYVHNPAQGHYLVKVAEERGAKIVMHTSKFYPDGWNGFLEDAVRFLKQALNGNQ